MVVTPFPHTYRVALDEHALVEPDHASIPIGPPPQFGGVGVHDWSPEDLLLGAVVACLRTTFDAYARRAALDVRAFHARAAGVLEKSREGPVFTSLRIDADVVVAGGAEERARCEETLARADRDCIISRALKTTTQLSVHVTAVPASLPATDAGSAATDFAPPSPS